MTAMQGSLSHTFLQTQATYIDAANLDQRHLIDRLSRVPRPICQGTIENIFKLKIEIYLRWLCQSLVAILSIHKIVLAAYIRSIPG